MVQQLPAIIVVAPLVTSFLIFFTGWWKKGFAYPLAMAAMSICLLSSISLLNSVINHGQIHYWFGGWMPPWGIEYRVDHLNAFILVLISFLGTISAIYAQKSVEKELPERISLFWSLYLLLMTGLIGISMTGDLFNLFVLLEVTSLTVYALVAIGDRRASVASFRYLIIGTIGASFYLLGVGYLYITTGSLNMEDLRQLLPVLYTSRVVKAAFVFIFIGMAIKIALFPLHAWQPDAYTFAPSAVSVIMSTAAAKTFAYALIRITYSVFTLKFVNSLLPVFEIICWIAALAMVAGSIFAIVQHDLKRMLAYSSVANVGYIVLAIGLAPSSSLGLNPAIMHILNHAVIKGGMFMTACAFIHKFGLRNTKNFVGLGRRMPYSSLGFILSALAMIGMPPSAGFITKWYLILAAVDSGNYIFVAVIFFSTLLMIIYFWRVVETMYIKTEQDTDKIAFNRVQEVPLTMLLPGLLLGILAFIIGPVWISGFFMPILNAINLSFGLGAAP